MLTSNLVEPINKTFDYACFEPETPVYTQAEEIADLKGMLADQRELIVSQRERLDEVEDELYFTQLHTPTKLERRSILVLRKHRTMPRRFAGRVLPTGRVYMESSEIRKFLMSEEVAADLRFNKKMKNTFKMTLEIMKLIETTYPDDYFTEQEGNKKKVWVLVAKETDE